jgi:hypothetical protein
MQDMGGNPVDDANVNGYVLTGATQDSQGGFRSINTATTGISGTVGTGITVTNANTGSGTDYYQPYLVINYIIKHD